MASFTLRINGRERSVEAEPEMPLLWVLRDLLGMTGTKFGCGAGLCGSCTVLADGEAIRSCVTPVSSVGGASLTTIEGLGAEALHPLQEAWIQEDVPQCGYCQPGQILSAASLLRRVPAPDDRAIDEAMGGNLCRCGTYQRIRAAIPRAAGGAGAGGSGSEP